MRRRKVIDRIIILLILIIIIATTGLLFTRLKTDKITSAIENGEDLNILIMVHDEGTLKFSELLLYNSSTGKGSLFDIPGYTGSIITRLKKMDRIDVLYDVADPSVYTDKVSKILNIEIPYFLSVESRDFASVVDLFDGLKIFIANPVENLELDNLLLLPSGNLVLDGAKTLTYLNLDDQHQSDIESISRRQKILQSLFAQIDENSIYLENREFNSYLKSYIDSNLNKGALISFFKIFKKLDTERIVFQRVLGNMRMVGENELLFPHYEGKLLRETVQQTIGSLANTEVISANELNVTIEILNATTQSGLASRTSQVFKSFGYDVMRVGNYSDKTLEKTIVVSRTGDRIAAEKVAEIILCKNISYDPGNYFESNPSLDDAEIIIILGKDFDGRYCKE